MRGFTTGVGSKTDIGGPPEDDTTATHRHPWWGALRSCDHDTDTLGLPEPEILGG